jgi:uncharacterized membrane protein YphA (DoxX/SURF4 family)
MPGIVSYLRGGPAPRSAVQLSAIVIRWAAAIVFILFGAGKFVHHASELASFRHYGLPAPDAFVYAVGVVEIGGGLLLASGRLIRLAALVLAGDMVGAIIVSGIGRGEDISLTLAPALLVAMLFLIAVSWPASADLRPGPRVHGRPLGQEIGGGR